jgi:hypothetical protein
VPLERLAEEITHRRDACLIVEPLLA